MSILWKRSSLGCCFDASYAFVIYFTVKMTR